MNQLFNFFLLAIAIVLLIPIIVLWVECFAAVLPERQRLKETPSERPTIAVLVPAHDEAAGIDVTLKTLLPQLTKQDRLVVVADNCSDETASVAQAAGAVVIERHDSERRGKGYALDFGLKFLASEPPEVVVVVDADCLVAEGSIENIAWLAAVKQRPVQASYLLTQPPNPSPASAVSLLAFTVKNLVRPVGLAQLGLPCLLTGTGMAFPWSVIQQVSLASGNLVEDMQLSLDLLIAGYPTIFCAEADVTGALPQDRKAATSQRTRWEHGHLKTLLKQVPRLLKAWIDQKRFALLAIALDLCIPPLSLLVMLWCMATIAAIAFSLTVQMYAPLLLLMVEGLLILVAITAAWAKFTRHQLPLSTLLAVPLYVLWKVPLYIAFWVKPQTKWVRTERDLAKSQEL
ncbi:glycosyltransferase family 2 protein [Stenomitos frigidus]|uniref:Glycosyl transferase n=1 Tax=Stenomitos frigidus ULC18 TaxID=2107698 RepID=A0A2T1ECY4_9CYAN|nr:glycosyltransferase family 2 protein [Stenomitos frigidus]PSB30574.1 glycosyl transferase [Stenomitos frigidus ULC18]